MSKVMCYNFQEMGHFARDCTKERVQAKSKPEAASMAFTEDEIANDNKREWILLEPRVLTVASGDNLVATAVGPAPLTQNGREVCILQDVLFVKGLARNLVSVAAASRRGMTVEFQDVTCIIRAPHGTSLHAPRKNTYMYVVDATSATFQDTAMMASDAPHVGTWHRRLGHLNTQSVQQLLGDIQLPGQGAMNQSCPTCVKGKLAQKPFTTKEKRQPQEKLAAASHRLRGTHTGDFT
ncbi:unnamed protein product [Phytophthora fragariaefolia]|uniref:Unnamed protein product n=1 Tax=Phytophthora fragariaefolia TaxID=1490495 RepID=A0A9W6WNK5_9STRA|nr:unnamed protein product [Phytophthora fragariaefolia]